MFSLAKTESIARWHEFAFTSEQFLGQRLARVKFDKPVLSDALSDLTEGGLNIEMLLCAESLLMKVRTVQFAVTYGCVSVHTNFRPSVC